MFVRVKTTPNSPKKAVQIVKSVRNGNKVSQRIVRHVGTALNDFELKRMKELAEYIKVQIETEVQPSIHKPEVLAEMAVKARNDKENKAKEMKVDLDRLREDQRVVVGIHEIYGQIYKELSFDFTLGNPKRKVAANKNLFNMVMARIANPSSKRASVINLERDFGVTLSLDGVYKTMDEISEDQIDFIQEMAYKAAQGILKEKVNVVFYDCTTLYFESFKEDELKQNGYSKDMKFNQPQVVLALIATREGFPIGYQVYPGSQYEGHTVRDAIVNLKKKYDLDNVFFVADSGMLNRENLELLEQSNINYIVGARLRNMDKKIQEGILDKSKYRMKEDGSRIAEFEQKNGRRLVVTFNQKRAEKDKHDRQKAVDKLFNKFKKSKRPDSLISNYGYKKYIEVIGESTVQINEEKIEKEALWDGLHGIITNNKEMTPEELKQQYRNLWQIEECFRISKHDLRIRPIYHWTPKRVRAHIAICFMALVCARQLAYRVATQYQPMSPEQIRNELVHVQVSILKHLDNSSIYGLPSKPTQHIRKIYQAMGRSISSTPYQIA